MSAANAQIVQAWLQANKGPQQMLGLLKQIGMQGQQAGQRTASGMNQIGRSVGRAVASFIGVGTAIQGIGTAAAIVRREWEQLKQVQERSLEVGLPAARELANLRLLGLPPGLQGMADELDELARAAATPIPVADRLRMVQEAISAGTDPSATSVRARAQLGLRVAELLGKALEERPDTLRQFARTTTVLQESFPELGSDELITTLGNALLTSPAGFDRMEEFNRNIIPAAVNLKNFGFNLRDALALLVGVQARTVDPEGATTRTNVFQLVELLNRKFIEAERFDLVNAGMRMLEFVQKSDDPLALKLNTEILRAQSKFLQELAVQEGISVKVLQTMQGIQKSQLADEVQARARGKFGVVELLQRSGVELPAGNVQQRVREAQQSLIAGQNAVNDFMRRMEEGTSSMRQLPLEIDAIIKQTEQRLLGRPGFAERQQAAAGLERLLPLLGDSALATSVTSMVQRLRTTESAPLETLRTFIGELESQERQLGRGETVGGRVFTRVREPTTEQQETVGILREMLVALRQLAEQQRMRTVPIEVPRPTPAVPPVVIPAHTEAAALGERGP